MRSTPTTSAPSHAWRPDDQALLERLENRELFVRLWRAEAGSAPEPHPRASGVLQVLRKAPRGPEALTALRQGDASKVQALLRPKSLLGVGAELCHFIAIYNARIADVPQVAPAVAEQARLVSLAAWVALSGEATYLRALAHAVLGADEEEAASAVRQAAMAPLDALGAAARAGGRDLDASSHSALRVLARVSDACHISGCAATTAKRFERHAEQLRARAIEVALAPIQSALSDATARGEAEVEGAALMERIVRVWNWAEADEHVERFAVDVFTPIAWNVYHAPDSERALARMIRPLVPLVERLAWRIEGDPSRIAYAAPCAQMFVFRAETDPDPGARRRFAERSLEICPSHRNGRLIVASMIAHEVRDRLDRSSLFLQGSDFIELEAQLKRIRDLYPRTRGLDELEERLAAARNKSWWQP